MLKEKSFFNLAGKNPTGANKEDSILYGWDIYQLCNVLSHKFSVV